jgi:hypothetical protein
LFFFFLHLTSQLRDQIFVLLQIFLWLNLSSLSLKLSAERVRRMRRKGETGQLPWMLGGEGSLDEVVNVSQVISLSRSKMGLEKEAYAEFVSFVSTKG